jgi:hypothetical protein
MAKRAKIRMFIKTNWCKIEYDLYSFVIDRCVACVAEPTHRDYFPLSSGLLHHTFAVRPQVKVLESKMIHQTSIDFHSKCTQAP